MARGPADIETLSTHGQLYAKTLDVAGMFGIQSGGRILLLHKGREQKRDGSVLLVGINIKGRLYPFQIGIQTEREAHHMSLHMIGEKNRLYMPGGDVLTHEQMGNYPDRYLATLGAVNETSFRVVDSNEFQFNLF